MHDDAESGAFDQSAEAGFAPDLPDTHHLGLKALLLTVWVVFSFGTSYFARDLQALVPHWPAAYWMAAQGSVLVFLLIIVVYCMAMDYFERREASEPEQAASSSASDPHV